jgi:hypothetical protein
MVLFRSQESNRASSKPCSFVSSICEPEYHVRLIFAYTGIRALPLLSRLIHRFGSIEHSVQVPAESLYEAAVEAMASFRRSVLAEMPLGSATRLTIRVKAPEEEHTITIGKVLAWLDGVAASPNEKLKKNRLKERLRI